MKFSVFGVVLFAFLVTCQVQAEEEEDLEEAFKRHDKKGHVAILLGKVKSLEQRLKKLGKMLIKGKGGKCGGETGGSHFIRWGKSDCPKGAELLYRGWVGGEHFTAPGGGVNYLCMPYRPHYLFWMPGFQAEAGHVFQTEYEVPYKGFKGKRSPVPPPHILHNLFRKNLEDHDAPCASCYVKRGAQVMIPGTFLCPRGWKREYFGYLMTENSEHAHPRDYVCVDRAAQPLPGTHPNRNGALLYPVESKCTTKICRQYKKGRELTCAVCTK